MTLEVLVSTMHRSDLTLPERMGLRSDAVIVNQCDRLGYDETAYGGRRQRWYHLPERGVGRSRNTALLHAEGDILLFADDDVEYSQDYEQQVLTAFTAHPEAGVIVFNLPSTNPARPEYIIQQDHRLFWFNCLRYGAFRIAARREALLRHGLTFSLLFGGGARHQAGEDNLFLTNCLQRGVICRACKAQIGTVQQKESTWFKGYDEKYYFDRGALFAAMYGAKAQPLSLLMELKTARRGSSVSFKRRVALARQGIREFRKLPQLSTEYEGEAQHG